MPFPISSGSSSFPTFSSSQNLSIAKPNEAPAIPAFKPIDTKPLDLKPVGFSSTDSFSNANDFSISSGIDSPTIPSFKPIESEPLDLIPDSVVPFEGGLDGKKGLDIPFTNARIELTGAKDRFTSRLGKAGSAVGDLGNKFKDKVKEEAGDLREVIKHPVEAFKGGVKAGANMFRDAFDAGDDIKHAVMNNGKPDPFKEKRSERPENQPSNRAQKAGGEMFDVAAAAVSADPTKGVGKVGKKVAGNIAGQGKKLVPAAVKVENGGAAAVRAEANISRAGSKGSGTFAASKRGSGAAINTPAKTVQPERLEPANAKVASQRFRDSHGLSFKRDALEHDTRHAILGQPTTRIGENVVNATENSLYKDLSNKTTNTFLRNPTGVKASFEGYVAKHTELANDAKSTGSAIVDRFRKGEIEFDQAKNELHKEGFRAPFDVNLSKLEKDGAIFRSDRQATSRFFDNQVSLLSKAPSRAESKRQFANALSTLSTLEKKNNLTPSQIIEASGKNAANVSFEVTPAELKAARDQVDKALKGVK